MSVKFLVLGRGVFWGFFGGGSADSIFMGARTFLRIDGSPHERFSFAPATRSGATGLRGSEREICL